MCFSIFNQYAQKLAFFAGNHLKKEANEVLENQLYFL